MRAFVFAISFLLAFLLFAVQPMATKMVLPTFGGSPAVWNTVMFTFQLLLLAGYIYAHVLARHVRARFQMPVHALVVLAACTLLPLTITLQSNEALVNNPIPHLVAAFLLQIGLPFFCLSATAPLLQSWVSRSGHPLAKTPYVLYSASNLGSFAGLIGYIVLVEPLMDLSQQRNDWSVLFVVGMGSLLFAAWRLRFTDAPQKVETTGNASAPTFKTRLGWVWLAFLPSSLSLGVTTYIATDVASIPLLWVIPLSIYLLSFVDAFRKRPIIVATCQRIAPILGLFALLVYGIGGHGVAITYVFQIITFASFAFALHGWLAMQQPATRHLTQFYVFLSVGGLLGGVLNGLIAPLMFRDALEYPIMLLLASITGFIVLRRHEDRTITVLHHLRMLGEVLVSVMLLTAVIYIGWSVIEGAVDFSSINSLILAKSAMAAGIVMGVIYHRYARIFYTCTGTILLLLLAVDNGVVGFTTLYKDRNFFGVSRVLENHSTNARYFMHDTTLHGLQSLDPKLAMVPQAYYSVLKDIFHALPITHQKPLAVVGLGVGTLKCLAVKHQQVDLYEINPMVRDIAQNPAYFTYMQGCEGDQKLLMGDGRIRLSEQPDGRYGVIIMDAFTSDAIPGHLLTREALSMYVRKLAPGGLLIMNTTNRHIDLWPLLGVQSESVGIVAYGKFFKAPEDNLLLKSSNWAVLARKRNDIAGIVDKQQGWQLLKGEGDSPWTDNYINLFPYFKALR